MMAKNLDFYSLSDEEFIDQNAYLSAERAWEVLTRLQNLEKCFEKINARVRDYPLLEDSPTPEAYETVVMGYAEDLIAVVESC